MRVTTDRETPRLRAVTRPLSADESAQAIDLLALADPQHPLLWHRDDRGCVGIGEALRLVFTGPERFAAAAAAWRRIAALAEIDDPVRLPGSGLVALGAFAFADESAAQSVLIVPRLLVARHRGAAWITEVTAIGGMEGAGGTGRPAGVDRPEPSVRSLGAPAPLSAWSGVDFAPRSIAPETGRPAKVGPAGAPALAAASTAAASAARSAAAARSTTPRSTAEAATAAPDSIAAYLAGVREAARRIERGDVEKIVLARQVEGRIAAGDDLRVPLRRLAERYLDCWTFAVDGLIGASPETLIRSTGGAVSARVLAGTRARHAENERRDARARNELLTSAKEQHEHAFAVQSVVTALAPHVRELRTSEEPFPLRLPNVWHLATDLGASLGESSSSLELVAALHPTAAVAGTPTADAVAAIAELEPFDRGRYSGAVGWIDASGDGEWVIALRCAQLGAVGGDAAGAGAEGGVEVGSRAIIASAGGGIVAGSDAEHELGETVSKLRPITEAFAR